MANLFCVKDKVVIITGGAGILGRGIAGHLAEEGAKISWPNMVVSMHC